MNFHFIRYLWNELCVSYPRAFGERILNTQVVSYIPTEMKINFKSYIYVCFFLHRIGCNEFGMNFRSCVAKDHLWITPRRNTIIREQPPSPRDPHKEFSQPITHGHLIYSKYWIGLYVYTSFIVLIAFIKKTVYNGHCWSLNTGFLL